MTNLPMSDDVLKLNPELETARQVKYKATERILKLYDSFDSDLEREYYAELMARGFEVRAHGWTFHLPGGVDYTPDFIAWRMPQHPLSPEWSIMVFEVKGNMRQKNARDSRTRFKIAAGLYPAMPFYWVTRSRPGAWREVRIIVT